MGQQSDRVHDLVELLKAQRSHVAEGARVLEAIISHCSELARHEAVETLRNGAAQMRDRAISMYALEEQRQRD